MEKEEIMERILNQVGVKIKSSQFGLIGKIFDLETSGFDVNLILPSETQFDNYKSKHLNCEIFLDARYDINTKKSNKNMYFYFQKLRINNPDKLFLEDNLLFFEKQRVCVYLRGYTTARGDDIPF